jgi:hypothetical protein
MFFSFTFIIIECLAKVVKVNNLILENKKKTKQIKR